MSPWFGHVGWQFFGNIAVKVRPIGALIENRFINSYRVRENQKQVGPCPGGFSSLQRCDMPPQDVRIMD
jgi:hypothetical protein